MSAILLSDPCRHAGVRCACPRERARMSHGMDPSRKRAIRLTVALTVAVLLASALMYTSFSAGRSELTASQLVNRAKPHAEYILAGTVLEVRCTATLDGVLPGAGSQVGVSVPVSYHGRDPRSVRGGPRGARQRPQERL